MPPDASPRHVLDPNDDGDQLVSLLGEGQVVLCVGRDDRDLAPALVDRGCLVSRIEAPGLEAGSTAAILEELVVADLDHDTLTAHFKRETFDAVVLGPAIASLTDPVAVLRDAASLLVDRRASSGAERGARVRPARPAVGPTGGPGAPGGDRVARRAFTRTSLCDLLEDADLAIYCPPLDGP